MNASIVNEGEGQTSWNNNFAAYGIVSWAIFFELLQ